MKLAVWRGRGRHHPSFFFGLVFLFSQLVVKQKKIELHWGLVQSLRRLGDEGTILLCMYTLYPGAGFILI